MAFACRQSYLVINSNAIQWLSRPDKLSGVRTTGSLPVTQELSKLKTLTTGQFQESIHLIQTTANFIIYPKGSSKSSNQHY